VATVKAHNPLLLSKQQEVARRVLEAGLSKSEFAFMDLRARQDITALVYLPDRRFSFQFFPGDNWVVNYSPAEHTVQSGEIGVGDWRGVLAQVDLWLRYLMRERDITDAWATFFEAALPFDIGSDIGEDSPLTAPEQQAIRRQLEDLKAYLLSEATDAEEDRHAILAAIGRIEGAMGRMGRLSWRSLTLGVLFELGLLGYATPEGVRHAVNLLLGAAQHLLR
jgi:hypothetical protein